MTSPGLADVARSAGVSIATASRVLSGRGPASPASRDAVRRAAADLGYVPHPVARRLAQREGLGPVTQRSVGGGSDGNFTAALGVPTLDGLGAVGGGAHAADEHVLVDRLVPRTALLVALLEDLLDAGT